jgi:prepilin-type processing-associated H-X9-DG protein
MDCPTWVAYGGPSPDYGFQIDGDGVDGFGKLGRSYYAFRHSGRQANVLFFDGHIEGMRHYNETGKRVWSWKYP